MNCRVEETNTFGRKIYVDISAADFNEQIDKKLRKLSSTAKIKGFRPGKAPMEVVKRYYGDEIKSDVAYDLLQRSYKEAIQQHSLQSMVAPSFEDMKIDQDKGISYTAYIEVIPDLQLNTLEGVTVEQPICEITEADIDTMVERVRKNHAKQQAGNDSKADEELVLPEMDEDFFKACNIEEGGLDALRRLLREGMEWELGKKLPRLRQTKIEDAMLEHNKIEAPPSMLKEQIEEMRKSALQNINDKNFDEKKLPDDLFTEAASRFVRLKILFVHLAEKCKLQPDRQSCEAKIDEIAQSYSEPDQLKNFYRSNAEAYRNIETMVLEDKIITHLTEKANVDEKKYSFYDIINPPTDDTTDKRE